MGSDYLFVYGTLMKQSGNEIALLLRKNSVFVGKGSFPGLAFDLGAYPGAIYIENSHHHVRGELFEIMDKGIWPILDQYEGIGDSVEGPDEYVRLIVPVSVNDHIYNAFVYLYNRSCNALNTINQAF